MSNPLNTRLPHSTLEMTSPSSPSPTTTPDYNVAERSCLHPFDVLKCCPTKGQLKDDALYNRMTMCFFAIMLMWVTSLKVAGKIVREP